MGDVVLNPVIDAIKAYKSADEIVKAACEAVPVQKLNLIMATIQAADQWVTEHLDRPRRFRDFIPTW